MKTTNCFGKNEYPEHILRRTNIHKQEVRMQLFEYAIIKHPTEKESDKGKKAEIVVDVRTVLASDQQKATLLAAREIPANMVDDLDNIVVVVRPF